MPVSSMACGTPGISSFLFPTATRLFGSNSLSCSLTRCSGTFLKTPKFVFPVVRKHQTGRLAHEYSSAKSAKRNVTIYAAFDDMSDDSPAIFPRIHVRDPYQRLGISREASEEEIQAARNFLIKQYGDHKPSVDAIESAHDKIIMQSFYERRRPKLNLSKKFREASQSHIVRAVAGRFQAPTTNFIIKTAITFIVLGALTVLFPTEEGPTLQVAISLALTVYFIYTRLKSRIQAFLYGVASFFVSWLLGTFLMVSIIPPLLQGPRSFEVTTSLISYILLWVSSTYLK